MIYQYPRLIHNDQYNEVDDTNTAGMKAAAGVWGGVYKSIERKVILFQQLVEKRREREMMSNLFDSL